ncbi:alpha/beta fold hydrolase [Hydrogenophaga sp. 2FB]|uniref:alpha/beta fold hydrolase n=1 Tax=Hydrogenophaga sp. 2FB TaxID=2502187 RepID=UPI0010F4E021|nr:alpha/beta fold hydrolase [Hydrogenophaga sp. 2FB]
MSNNAALKIHRSGTKGAPKLVLLHGFLAASGYWTPLYTELKGYFDLIAIDMPGFGDSADVPAPDSLEGVAEMVMQTLNQVDIDRFSLLGFSMGGMVAQQIALDHGDRLDNLVLYGTAPAGDLPGRFESWDASVERVQSQGLDSLTDKAVASWFVNGNSHPFYDTCRAACAGASKASSVTLMRAMQKWNVVDRLQTIQTKTLVLVGDRDQSTKPADSLRMWQEIPEAALCVLPNCSHGAHMEAPHLFNRIVRDFLSTFEA